jgi:hypothetical protein
VSDSPSAFPQIGNEKSSTGRPCPFMPFKKRNDEIINDLIIIKMFFMTTKIINYFFKTNTLIGWIGIK